MICVYLSIYIYTAYLQILSGHYEIEMDVVDTVNAIINRFGEDKNYSQRIFLIFDGIHYDPLYLEPAAVSYIFICIYKHFVAVVQYTV